MARSLLDDPRFESIGKGKGGGSRGGGGGMSGDKIKLIAAIVLFVLAGGVFAWYYELIPLGGGKRPVHVVTQEDKQNFEQQQAQQKQAIDRGQAVVGGD